MRELWLICISTAVFSRRYLPILLVVFLMSSFRNLEAIYLLSTKMENVDSLAETSTIETVHLMKIIFFHRVYILAKKQEPALPQNYLQYRFMQRDVASAVYRKSE